MQWIILLLEIAVLLGVGALFRLGRATRAYSEEKGKNLATKEDIATITRQIESVRAEYAERIQKLDHENALLRDADQRRHQLSMAALDKRLEVHQKAFSLWRQMMSQANAQDNFQFFKGCELWWEENCLYLSTEAGFAFKRAMTAAYLHSELKAAGGLDKENWKEITSAGEVIAKAVQLPGLGLESIGSQLSKRDGDG
jgi:hypothetical protein